MASFPLDLQQNFHKLAQHWVWGETNSLVSLLEEDMHARGLKQDDPCCPFQHRPFYDSFYEYLFDTYLEQVWKVRETVTE